jgi:VWFA-related protein
MVIPLHNVRQGGVMSSDFLIRGLRNRFLFATLGMVLFHPLESTGWASPFQEGSSGTLRVDVDLVTVEVIVQDKKGYPILGLKKEDFKLFDDGKLQQIVTFDAVADSGDKTVPTSLNDIDEAKRGKVVLILFDDSNITPQQLKMSRDTAVNYVKQHMRPWDLFAVASYGLSLKISQTFTHDIAKVIEAIQLPALSYALQDRSQSQISDNQDPNFASVPGQGPGQVPGQRGGRAGSQTFPGQSSIAGPEAKYRGMVYLRTLSGLSTSISRIKGRKIVLMFSEDFKLSNELQNELQNLITVSQKSNVAYYTVDSKGLSVVQPVRFGSQGFLPQHSVETRGRVNHQLWSWHALVRLLFPAIDLLKPDPAALLAANLFQGQGGGQSGGQGGGGQSGGGSPGGTAGGASSAPAQGGLPPGRQSNYPTSGQGSQQPGLYEMQQGYLENILRSLAHSTGGTSVFNTNNLNQGLDKVDLELSNYYVLGFNPSSSKRNGKLRKIEVKTEAKGAKLKYRSGYIDPRPPDSLAGSKEERSLLSAISSPTPITQLPVMFRPEYFYDAPTLVRVPITASIQHGAIELKKKGAMLVNSIDVMGVAYGEDGSVAARFSETLNLSVEKDKEAAFRNQDIPYQNYIKLRPGKYHLKMAVADDKGKIGTTEQLLVIPPFPSDGMASSSLVITQQMTQLPELIRSIQSKLMEENDPLSYKGLQLIPDVDQIVSKEGKIAVYYKVYNLKSSAQNRHLVAKIQVSDEKGVPATTESINLDEAIESTGDSEAAIGFSIPLKDLAPGKYQLTIVTQDEEQKQSVTSGTELILR